MKHSRIRSESYSQMSFLQLWQQIAGRWQTYLVLGFQIIVTILPLIFVQAWDALVMNAVLITLLFVNLTPVNAKWEPWNEINSNAYLVAMKGNINLRKADDASAAVMIASNGTRLQYIGIRLEKELLRSRIMDWWINVTGREEVEGIREEGLLEGEEFRKKPVAAIIGKHDETGRWIRDNDVEPVKKLLRFEQWKSEPGSTDDDQSTGKSQSDHNDRLPVIVLPLFATPKFHDYFQMVLLIQDSSTGASNSDFSVESFLFHNHLLAELSSWYKDGEPDGRGYGFGRKEEEPVSELVELVHKSQIDDSIHQVEYIQNRGLWSPFAKWNDWLLETVYSIEREKESIYDIETILERLQRIQHKYQSCADTHIISVILQTLSWVGNDTDEEWTEIAAMVDHPRLELVKLMKTNVGSDDGKTWWSNFAWMPTLSAYLGVLCLWKACRIVPEYKRLLASSSSNGKSTDHPDLSQVRSVICTLWEIAVAGIHQGLHAVTVPYGQTIDCSKAEGKISGTYNNRYAASFKEPGVLVAALLAKKSEPLEDLANRHEIVSQLAYESAKIRSFPNGLDSSTLTPKLAERDYHTGLAYAYELMFRLSTAQLAFSSLITLKEVIEIV